MKILVNREADLSDQEEEVTDSLNRIVEEMCLGSDKDLFLKIWNMDILRRVDKVWKLCMLPLLWVL